VSEFSGNDGEMRGDAMGCGMMAAVCVCVVVGAWVVASIAVWLFKGGGA